MSWELQKDSSRKERGAGGSQAGLGEKFPALPPVGLASTVGTDRWPCLRTQPAHAQKIKLDTTSRSHPGPFSSCQLSCSKVTSIKVISSFVWLNRRHCAPAAAETLPSLPSPGHSLGNLRERARLCPQLSGGFSRHAQPWLGK